MKLAIIIQCITLKKRLNVLYSQLILVCLMRLFVSMMVQLIKHNMYLQNYNKNIHTLKSFIRVIKAARSRNVGLEAMSEDVDAFLFLDADDEFYLVGLI